MAPSPGASRPGGGPGMGRPAPPPGGAAAAPVVGAGEAFTRPIYGIARRSDVPHLALASLPVGEDQIQAPARIVQHLLGLCDLLLAARAADLHEREVDLALGRLVREVYFAFVQVSRAG